MELFEHQVKGLEWLKQRDSEGIKIENSVVKGGLLCDDPGMGKTQQIIELIKSRNTQTLLIVPACTLRQWIQCLNKNDLYDICQYFGYKRQFQIDKKIILTSFDIITRDIVYFSPIHWGRIIIDEVHEVRNKKTKRYKSIMRLQAVARFGMSGTPIHKNQTDLATLINLVSHKYFSNYEEARRKLVLRRNKDQIEYLPLADVNIENIQIPFETQEEAENYRAIATQAQDEINEILTNRQKTQLQRIQCVLELLLRQRQALIDPNIALKSIQKSQAEWEIPQDQKLYSKLSYIKDFIEKTDKPIMFLSHFKEETQAICKISAMLGKRYCKIDGSVSQKRRQQILFECKYDELRPPVLVLQIQAAGVGLNIQGFNEIIISSPDYSPMSERQGIARAHRIGSKGTINVKRLVVIDDDDQPETIEQKILKLSQQKRELIAGVMGKDRSYLETGDNLAYSEFLGLLGYTYKQSKHDVRIEQDVQIQQRPQDYPVEENCCICLSKKPQTRITECGHASMCLLCAGQIYQRGDGCPICRQKFSSIQPL